ncbi:hypothetical protein EHS25_008260 [Saitozyma podzolica]|uniref:Uncharacterized protein n=1 Tax=Saitozyma podzolica TaxID=1890683 RepID=A0A427YNY4_9TREE|nr:hypothetical protein EHS25_008260 [Saitozyma podzolica]
MSSIAETDVQSEILPDYASETATLTNDCASETATLTNESHALEFTTTKLDRGLTGSRINSFPRRDVSLLRIYNHREPTSLPNALRQTLARRSCSEGRAHYELHFLLTGPGVSHGESDSRDINAAQIVALQIAEQFGSTEFTRRAHDTSSREEEDAITREAFEKLSNIVEVCRQTHAYLQPLNTTVYDEIRPELIHPCDREWERTDGATDQSLLNNILTRLHLRPS